jgi:YidC/Oxa1 family membrane protein insertase
MTDIRRTLLWVVFTMSLVLLWDAWNKHNGQPTLFGPRPQAASAAGGGWYGAWRAGGRGRGRRGQRRRGRRHAGRRPRRRASASTSPPTGSRPRFNSQGGTLVGWNCWPTATTSTPSSNVVLLDLTDKRQYVAQTGLITNQAGCDAAHHLTPMTAQPGERTLAAGADELKLRFEARPMPTASSWSRPTPSSAATTRWA